MRRMNDSFYNNNLSKILSTGKCPPNAPLVVPRHALSYVIEANVSL